MASQLSVERVLITGGMGFLGKAVARRFKAAGARVVGLGHGTHKEAGYHGYDRWLTDDVCEAALSKLSETFDVIVHCAGQSSVARSLEQPLEDFRANVQATAELLEYQRCSNPDAIFIHASSAAVYGVVGDHPLRTVDSTNPVSPYGFHKQMTESLLDSYRTTFGMRCVAVRFFSVYGPGLQRQLLWDASKKLSVNAPTAVFWGTGEETRDWIHVDDAADLIAALRDAPDDLVLINGGSGDRVTVADTLGQLRIALGSDTEIRFNGNSKAGDPLHYHADMTEAAELGWRPNISLHEGLFAYAQWFKSII